jgi:hypothetical protein
LEERREATLEDICKMRGRLVDRVRGRVVTARIREDPSDVVNKGLWCRVLEAAKVPLDGAEVRRLRAHTGVVRQVECNRVDRSHKWIG